MDVQHYESKQWIIIIEGDEHEFSENCSLSGW